ncbi:MAG TPA: twin-arginine translocation signal domain-containing protein [Pyrinomonadaceae bacterium]|nr:twin-arginine translocation signal domain-containing protein [Pyrinomonadaceae bacterium]
MNIPRRTFIKAGAVAAACAGLPLSIGPASAQKQGGGRRQEGYFAIPAEVQDDPTSYYNMATFAPYVNTGFLVLIGRAWKHMKLVEVKNLRPRKGDGAANSLEESFSLTFLASRGQKIEQKVYSIRHAALGKFSLFLVPIGRRTRTTPEYYEAVINRRTP